MLRAARGSFLALAVLAAGCGGGTTQLATTDAEPARPLPVRQREVQPPPTTTTTVAPTTTTTPVPPTTTAPPPPPPPPAAGSGQVGGYPCGGDLPPCWVLARESGGVPTAVNATGCGGASCGGLWQFDPRTWAGFGGYARAEQAPAEVQNQAARQLWAGGAGCAHWAAC